MMAEPQQELMMRWMMRIINDDRPDCDICINTGKACNGGGKADYSITIEPIIKQIAKGTGTIVYLCAKHHRLMMKTIDNMIDS